MALQTTEAATGGVWPALLIAWSLLGVAYSAVMTPTGRLLRRSAEAGDRPAIFAAQFALSHACWLITYPLAGWLGSTAGISATITVLGLLALVGFGLAVLQWPMRDPEILLHDHPDLPTDHPHLEGQRGRHAHVFVIDDRHSEWPRL